MDKHAYKDFDKNYVKMTINTDLGYKLNHYINIFGDYIIDAYLDMENAKRIDEFYKKNKKISPNMIEELRVITNQKGRNRLVISKNKKRAHKLRKKLAKDFHIPEPFRSNL
jgi:ribosomal protein S1